MPATESGWALLFVLEENAEPAFAQGYGRAGCRTLNPPSRKASAFA